MRSEKVRVKISVLVGKKITEVENRKQIFFHRMTTDASVKTRPTLPLIGRVVGSARCLRGLSIMLSTVYGHKQ